ncbi:hypothetical protein PR202_ga29640 [Eleusine coracana subsp. coracana]|uniref:Uncharacterized protein n=1 Tax=Eleusine coracana subsp. coracana TaxID=191504 RepID=A0AAV5DLZ1_ELECO|nr:hypothetical protein QOZ80_7AG0571350 [Eleusine coracana subsp. coracana]GJN11446.1 hypothetical protein PR202_ga29640 [Eleusine coracana subsp. coracana]
MAPNLNMTAIVVALIVLASAQAQQGWAMAAADMVPVSPARNTMVAMPGGGVGTLAAPVCLQCRCCSRKNPAQCVTVSCCSTFNCDTAGKCNLVPEKCDCQGCGGAN